GHRPLQVARDVVQSDASERLSRPLQVGRPRGHQHHRRVGREEHPRARRELRALDPDVDRAGNVPGAELLGPPDADHPPAPAHGPGARASRTWAAVSGLGSPVEGRAGALFFAMMRSKFGGLGGSPFMRCWTKSSTPVACSATLNRRSKPIVEPVLLDIARPHEEPAPWPRSTSTLSGSVSRRRVKLPYRFAAARSPPKSGRPTSPTNSVSPVRTNQGSSPRPRSVTSSEMLSGV